MHLTLTVSVMQLTIWIGLKIFEMTKMDNIKHSWKSTRRVVLSVEIWSKNMKRQFIKRKKNSKS